MRVLVDENIPRMTVDALHALGHDVKDIRGTSDHGLADCDLWGLALAESRALVTTDKVSRSTGQCPTVAFLSCTFAAEPPEDSPFRYARDRLVCWSPKQVSLLPLFTLDFPLFHAELRRVG